MSVLEKFSNYLRDDLNEDGNVSHNFILSGTLMSDCVAVPLDLLEYLTGKYGIDVVIPRVNDPPISLHKYSRT